LIGAVGRLSAEKGFDTLILAADQLLKHDLNVEVVIVGEGDERSRLEELIAGLNRQDRIRLVGYQSDVRELYQAMDVFALSSLREGLPNVLLEAMALEVPVVATRIAGVPQVVHDGDNGLLVDPGSIDQMVQALRRLTADQDLRARLAAEARKTIEESFSFEQRMRKIAKIYDQVLRRNGERS
jgi:glycosyltransferase involved in cell wall biosynthesis